MRVFCASALVNGRLANAACLNECPRYRIFSYLPFFLFLKLIVGVQLTLCGSTEFNHFANTSRMDCRIVSFVAS